MRIDPSRRLSTQAQRNAYDDEVLNRARATPGIASAALTDQLPLGGDRSWNIAGKGQVYARGHLPEGFARVVSDHYFEALGLRLIKGRDFRQDDRSGAAEAVIIVNETLARTLSLGQDAIGQATSPPAAPPASPHHRVARAVVPAGHAAVEAGYGRVGIQNSTASSIGSRSSFEPRP